MLYKQFRDPCWVGAVCDAYHHLSGTSWQLGVTLNKKRQIAQRRLAPDALVEGRTRQVERRRGGGGGGNGKEEEESVWKVSLIIINCTAFIWAEAMGV